MRSNDTEGGTVGGITACPPIMGDHGCCCPWCPVVMMQMTRVVDMYLAGRSCGRHASMLAWWLPTHGAAHGVSQCHGVSQSHSVTYLSFTRDYRRTTDLTARHSTYGTGRAPLL